MPCGFPDRYDQCPWGGPPIRKVRQAIKRRWTAKRPWPSPAKASIGLTHGLQHPGDHILRRANIGKGVLQPEKRREGKAAPAKRRDTKGRRSSSDRQHYKNHHETAVVASEQLKKAGMNVRSTSRLADGRSTPLKPEAGICGPSGSASSRMRGPYTCGLLHERVRPARAFSTRPIRCSRADAALNTSLKGGGPDQGLADFQKRSSNSCRESRSGDLGRYQPPGRTWPLRPRPDSGGCGTAVRIGRCACSRRGGGAASASSAHALSRGSRESGMGRYLVYRLVSAPSRSC